MVTLTKQSLLYSENLTLPSFQVIVMTANMGCARRREEVSQITSKMTGLKEYIVDVANKQVPILDFIRTKNMQQIVVRYVLRSCKRCAHSLARKASDFENPVVWLGDFSPDIQMLLTSCLE